MLSNFFSHQGLKFVNLYYKNVFKATKNTYNFFWIFYATNKGEKIPYLSPWKNFALSQWRKYCFFLHLTTFKKFFKVFKANM